MRLGLVGLALAVAALGIVLGRSVLGRSTLGSADGEDTVETSDGAPVTADEHDAAETSAGGGDEDGDDDEGASVEASPSEPDPDETAAPADSPQPVESEPVSAMYEFEADPQGWAASSDPDECPDADVTVVEGAGRNGSNALAWTLPSPFQNRCVIEVNIVGSPPDGQILDALDRTTSQVGCFVKVPPELRDGSLNYFERQYFGIWSLDDGSRHEHFGPEVLPDEDSPDWIQVDMLPGQADYRTLALNTAPRDHDFGAVETYRIWMRSDTSVELSGPVLLDDCWVASSE